MGKSGGGISGPRKGISPSPLLDTLPAPMRAPPLDLLLPELPTPEKEQKIRLGRKIKYSNGFEFSDAIYCIAVHQMNSVRFRRCNGLHHVITTLELQGQNCCIKSSPGNFHDVVDCIALHQVNVHPILMMYVFIFLPQWQPNRNLSAHRKDKS